MSPAISDDDKTSGSTSDNDPVAQGRCNELSRHGPLASVCDAHCVLVDGNRDERLNKKVCKRPGVQLVTLLDIPPELYSGGMLVNPTHADHVQAQLRTFHR